MHSLSASASVSRDFTNSDEFCIFSKSVWVFVVRIIVLRAHPTQPPSIR